MDAHEFAPKGQKSLILLTFSLWHLNWLYNTKKFHSRYNFGYGILLFSRKTTPEVKELRGYIADHHEALLGMLTDKQKETFEKFDDCWDELTDINEREIFVYAFKLGARIAIDVLTER